MRLLRYAIAEFTPTIPRMARWIADVGYGVQVRIEWLAGPEEVALGTAVPEGQRLVANRQGTSCAMLLATVETAVESHGRLELSFDDQARRLAEEALRLMAASLAVQSQSACHLFSPTPYVALQGESEDDRKLLDQCIRIQMPTLKPFHPLANLGLEWPMDLTQLSDRRQGLLLLGAAMNAGHGIANLHELFRLFEHAFAKAGAGLVGPLTAFLRSHDWDLGYSEAEVSAWVNELRHPATHADLGKQTHVAADRQVQPYIPRIEQAAIDVFLNKRIWHSPDPGREEKASLRCAVTSTGSLIQSSGAHTRLLSGWDLHETFPLRGTLEFQDDQETEFGLKMARWHFTEQEHAKLAKYDNVGSD